MAYRGLVLGSLLLIALPLSAQSSGSHDPGLTLCPGPYALCAASTCTLTGHTYPGTRYPEVVCTCPVLQGPSIAMVNTGAMKGSCKPPVDPVTKKEGVWSLYSTTTTFPQKVNGVWTADMKSTPQNCPSTGGTPPKPLLFGQCFNYACKNLRQENGILVADCSCPGEKVTNPKKTAFATQAGQCQTTVCTQIPVGAAVAIPGNAFCTNQN